jgi:hypothetical protein
VAGAHADHKSTVSRGAQRGPALQEAVVAGTRTAATGVGSPSSVRQPSPTQSTGVDGSTKPDRRGMIQAIEQEVEKYPEAETEDTSRSRRLDRTGLRADRRQI